MDGMSCYLVHIPVHNTQSSPQFKSNFYTNPISTHNTKEYFFLLHNSCLHLTNSSRIVGAEYSYLGCFEAVFYEPSQTFMNAWVVLEWQTSR